MVDVSVRRATQALLDFRAEIVWASRTGTTRAAPGGYDAVLRRRGECRTDHSHPGRHCPLMKAFAGVLVSRFILDVIEGFCC